MLLHDTASQLHGWRASTRGEQKDIGPRHAKIAQLVAQLVGGVGAFFHALLLHNVCSPSTTHVDNPVTACMLVASIRR